MRARLTASFVVLTVVLLLGALAIRSYTASGELRTHEGRELRVLAQTVALLVEQRQLDDLPIDRMFLASVVDTSDRITFRAPDGAEVSVEGKAYDGGGDDPILAELDAGGGSLVLSRSDQVVADLVGDDSTSLGFLVLLVGLLAALVGYLMARLLSSPFRQLAGAAGQLGRGRFDLDLPRTRIPEARAISQALLTSAGQLQERLASEQTFAEHASHVLRSPLTGLRLELEDLAGREDLPPDARDGATRAVGRIEAMDEVAGDLVALARRGALVAGAEIPLRDLATQCAQTWADALAEQDRPVTAAVEGNIEATYTPGPVEHILDLLLADVLRRGVGAVRMVFEADDEGHLSIALTCAGLRELPGPPGPNADIALTQARAVVTALGGRLTGSDPQQLSILLPQR